MPEKQSPGPNGGGSRATAADLSGNCPQSTTTASVDSLIDQDWAEWASTAEDDDLFSVYEAAKLRQTDLQDDPDAAEPGEFVHLSRQVHTLRQVIDHRAAERGGIVRDGQIVTFHDTPLTDLGNAERLVAHFGRDLQYCHAWGKWLVWDGRRWKLDASAAVMRLAKRTVRTIYREAGAHPDTKERKHLADWAVRSESRPRLEAMIALAESEHGIPVLPDQLDSDPWLFNCLNGTLDLRTGKLRPHRRADLITKLAPVDYDPGATCPTFDRFLSEIQPDSAVRSFVQRAAGYSLTGSTRERVFFISHGVGRNGKSTLQETLAATLGDYATRTPTETLMVKRDGGIPNDIARLKGARFVSASETEDGRRLAESLVKELTGGDTITARFLHAEWFDFRPEFKLWLSTNHKPTIRGTDAAIWDRVRLIPFDVRIPDEQLDPDLTEKLRAELPGILAWAVAGCLDWQRDGLGTPEAVATATGAYRAEMDLIGAWLEECCVQHPNAKTPATTLYQSFAEWCQANGEPRTPSQREFGMRLTERGFERKRGTGGRYWWHGLGLLSEPSHDPDGKSEPSVHSQNPHADADSSVSVTHSDPDSGNFRLCPPRVEITRNQVHYGSMVHSPRCAGCRASISVVNPTGLCGRCAGKRVAQ